MGMEYCEHYDLPKEMCAHCKEIDKPEVPELKTATCKYCGNDDVAWKETAKGGWCLYNINADGRLSTVPHFLSCPKDEGRFNFIE